MTKSETLFTAAQQVLPGGVNSPQLHFEIRAGKKAVNPRSYLQ